MESHCVTVEPEAFGQSKEESPVRALNTHMETQPTYARILMDRPELLIRYFRVSNGQSLLCLPEHHIVTAWRRP
jgi:hypothetical protein